MQTVDVLGDDPSHQAGLLHPRQRPVTRVRAGVRDTLPAYGAPSPVPTSGHWIADELLVECWTPDLLLGIGAAIVGDAGLGAAPRPAQHQDASLIE